MYNSVFVLCSEYDIYLYIIFFERVWVWFDLICVYLIKVVLFFYLSFIFLFFVFAIDQAIFFYANKFYSFFCFCLSCFHRRHHYKFSRHDFHTFGALTTIDGYITLGIIIIITYVKIDCVLNAWRGVCWLFVDAIYLCLLFCEIIELRAFILEKLLFFCNFFL